MGFANVVDEDSGNPSVFFVVVLTIVVWLTMRPIFQFSNTSQLIMSMVTKHHHLPHARHSTEFDQRSSINTRPVAWRGVVARASRQLRHFIMLSDDIDLQMVSAPASHLPEGAARNIIAVMSAGALPHPPNPARRRVSASALPSTAATGLSAGVAADLPSGPGLRPRGVLRTGGVFEPPRCTYECHRPRRIKVNMSSAPAGYDEAVCGGRAGEISRFSSRGRGWAPMTPRLHGSTNGCSICAPLPLTIMHRWSSCWIAPAYSACRDAKCQQTRLAGARAGGLIDRRSVEPAPWFKVGWLRA